MSSRAYVFENVQERQSTEYFFSYSFSILREDIEALSFYCIKQDLSNRSWWWKGVVSCLCLWQSTECFFSYSCSILREDIEALSLYCLWHISNSFLMVDRRRLVSVSLRMYRRDRPIPKTLRSKTASVPSKPTLGCFSFLPRRGLKRIPTLQLHFVTSQSHRTGVRAFDGEHREKGPQNPRSAVADDPGPIRGRGGA